VLSGKKGAVGMAAPRFPVRNGRAAILG